MPTDTERALAAMTDEGLFEKLATAVLRTFEPLAAGLAHTGMNAEGRTQASPVDGLHYVRGANPPHVVIAQHTITAVKRLEKKWLFGPVTPSAPARGRRAIEVGDVIKAAEQANVARVDNPAAQATLFLTTNQEPQADLISKVAAAAAKYTLDIEIWSRSRIAHLLDTDPKGQWLRHQYLGIVPQRLSSDLLRDLSNRSLEANRPLGDERNWINRAGDHTLVNVRRGLTLLIAASGQGKSVACYRALMSHVARGGFGIVLSDTILAGATTLDQAIRKALRDLHPTLYAEDNPLSLCSPELPLLIVVEDINHSGQAARLIEKIATWSQPDGKDKQSGRSWRILCPVWPQTMATLAETTKRAIDPSILYLEPLTRTEGTKAVLARAAAASCTLSDMEAEGISAALGDDPLLIALQDLARDPHPENTISAFLEDELQRTQASSGEPAAALRDGLLNLAKEMLHRRRLEPSWLDISGWNLDSNTREQIKILTKEQGLVAFQGHSTDLKLRFRHDRIRDWILAEAIKNNDCTDIESDPFFAEIIGGAFVRRGALTGQIARLQQSNPLALFFSLKLTPPGSERQRIVEALSQWLADPAHGSSAFNHLRWEALAVLSQVDGLEIPKLAGQLSTHSPSGWIARMRNGDLNGGFEMCAAYDMGVTDPARDQVVAHAKLKYGNNLISAMNDILRRPGINGNALAGVLRVAGLIGDIRLAPALMASWSDRPSEQLARLRDYLWALCRCVDKESAEASLAPVCDLWASLPDDDVSNETVATARSVTRSSIMADSIGFAFSHHPPENAIDYLVTRAEFDQRLTWPITYMLRTVDHPQAVAFVASEIAKTIRKHGWAVSADFIESDWQRAQNNGRPMSPNSRAVLLALWQNPANDKALRSAGLRLWSATKDETDLSALTEAANDPDLKLSILRHRLERNDHQAIPDLLDRLRDPTHQRWWWPMTRHVWCSDLADAFDEYLESWKNCGPDDQDIALEDVGWQTVAVLCRMDVQDAERLLLKHWPVLKAISAFIHAAIYVGTPNLLALADQEVKASNDPKALFRQLRLTYGLQIQPHPGIVREGQVLHLEPYLSFLSQDTIVSLAHACNEHGWFDTRRSLLDHRFENQRECWKIASAFNYFDKIHENRRAIWIDREIDEALRTGLDWGTLRDALLAWVTERKTMGAARIAWSAMSHHGLRSDLTMLNLEPWMDQTEASDLLADVHYAIRRRSAI